MRFFVTAATDGHLAFWDLGGSPQHGESNQPFHIHRVHQSSIKSMALATLHSDSSSYLIFTGGDDNGLAVTRVSLSDRADDDGPLEHNPPKAGTSTLLMPRAHAAAITAITILPPQRPSSNGIPTSQSTHTVVTTGNDQRIKRWSFTIDAQADGVDGVHVQRISNDYTPVADAACIDLMVDSLRSSEAKVLVCGVGMDVWREGPCE